MTDKPHVPEHVQRLGNLLKPCLNQRLTTSAATLKPRFSGNTFAGQASDYLHLLQGYLDSLRPTFEALMVEIINNPEVSDAVMNRRTQAFLNDLGDWHQAEMEIRNMNVDAADQPGLILLISVYCHCLDLVDEWLRRLIKSIDNPGSMLERQGIPPDKLPDAPLELTVCLRLTQAPDLPQLHRWLNQRNGQLTAASTKKIKRDVGILAFLLGLFWLH